MQYGLSVSLLPHRSPLRTGPVILLETHIKSSNRLKATQHMPHILLMAFIPDLLEGKVTLQPLTQSDRNMRVHWAAVPVCVRL